MCSGRLHLKRQSEFGSSFSECDLCQWSWVSISEVGAVSASVGPRIFLNPFRYRRPFENFGQNWDPKIGQKSSIRGSPIEISAEVIILGIVHRLVRNFDWGPSSNRGFSAYFRIPILTKIFEWTLVTKRVTPP